MKTEYDDIIKDLHELADWVERANSVQCFSVPRKAAYLITAITDDNTQLRLLLNKKDITLKERFDRIIGKLYFTYYTVKKKWKKT